MSGNSGIVLKVTTEELLVVAGEVEDRIKQLNQDFENIESIIYRSNSYWEGEGQNAYLRLYQSKKDIMQEAVTRFRNNVENLKNISGVYSAMETAVTETAQALESDVII